MPLLATVSLPVHTGQPNPLSPWQQSPPQTCVWLNAGASVISATISAAWGGRLQIVLYIEGYCDASLSLDKLDDSASKRAPRMPGQPVPLVVRCAMMTGNPFCPPSCGYGCIEHSAPTDFRLPYGISPVGMFSMHDRFHRSILLVTKNPEGSRTSWIARCAPISDLYSVECICAVDSHTLEHHHAVKRMASMHPGVAPKLQTSAKGHSGALDVKVERKPTIDEFDAVVVERKLEGEPAQQWGLAGGDGEVMTSLSPDGTMLAVAGRLSGGGMKYVVVLDVRRLQQSLQGPGDEKKGTIQVC